MSKTPLRLALFDCDGTLVDSAFAIQRAMIMVFQQFSYSEPSLDETKSVIGLSLDLAIAHLLKRPVDDEIWAMVAAYKENYRKIRSDVFSAEPLFPGVLDMLSTLEKDDTTLLGVVTGKSRMGIDRICEAYKLHCFITIKTADDCPSKPNPAMVIESCKQTGVFPESTYVIGDSIYDMQMAKLAKAKAVGVSWGYHMPDALRAAGADFIAREPKDLLSILKADAHA
ncbi:HAD-IA family hydrolase [uncultured Bartonella sp.]|uniref:HAD-IA family hydrolase n=1 Tax=uncultured Bartonella sp. TaxID=104108 RepID=UPI00260E7F93|nr:HAD-IA family hydrolase [uncultured Bartonella sp.]